jgi:2-dehydro-3-deoxygalactonokinase
MNQAAYAAVDWGTSSFRLWLVDGEGRALAERRSDEGMMVTHPHRSQRSWRAR